MRRAMTLTCCLAVHPQDPQTFTLEFHSSLNYTCMGNLSSESELSTSVVCRLSATRTCTVAKRRNLLSAVLSLVYVIRLGILTLFFFRKCSTFAGAEKKSCTITGTGVEVTLFGSSLMQSFLGKSWTSFPRENQMDGRVSSCMRPAEWGGKIA